MSKAKSSEYERCINLHLGSSAKGCDLEGYQFRKIRNSVAVKAEQAGLSNAEFKSIFGWEKPDKMLNDFYSDRSQKVADRGIEKLTDMRKKFDR